MGLLKRKRSSPPESPAPGNKKRTATEEAEELPKTPSSSSSEPAAVEGTSTPGKGQAGTNRAAVSGDTTRVSKQPPSGRRQGNESVKDPEEEAGRSSFEKDVDDLQNRVPSSVENVSHGQGNSFQQTTSAVALAVECEPQSPAVTPHRIPSHAGWFDWGKIHALEKLVLPEFFNGKNNQKTVEIYTENRNCIVTKYRENPKKLIKYEDVQGQLTGDMSGAARLFGFLDHWGLINYQAINDFSPFLLSRGSLGNMEEASNGALQLSPLVKPALATLFQFEATLAPPMPKLLSTCPPGPEGNLPLSSLAEAAVQESLSAPAVEYHCNSCQADCSKRRYHCQKQADFDLCPDCYSDGKFGQDMTGTDFLRMDALTETADANGGGWSDQETLLLLEALELYGDNWSEIAEHVATKSKSQCILHFIRLPIEDPFLEDLEESKSVTTTASPPGAGKSGTKDPPGNEDSQNKTPQNGNCPSGEAVEVVPTTPESHTSMQTDKGKQDAPGIIPTAESKTPASSKKPEEKESDASKASPKIEGPSKTKHPLVALSESAGCAGPEGLIAFADAGNPVMTQVALLAAMVGPRVAAAAAQAALKSLAEDDPVGFLSARNSYTLDSSDKKDGILELGAPERLTTGSQPGGTVTSPGDPKVSSDTKATLTTAEEPVKEDILEKGSLDKTTGEEGEAKTSQKSEAFIPTTTAVTLEQDAPTVAKVRSAAASALASAAVKAKLLADQEEREIQRLVASVIENQLKKLELKLKHFNELESMLGKECEQAEKSRAKVYAERARIVASCLGSSSTASQMQQSTGSISTSYPKSSAQPSSFEALPRPAVFTFGPTGVSAPAAVYKPSSSGPESSTSSMPADASSHQGLPQRLARPNMSLPLPRPNLASTIK